MKKIIYIFLLIILASCSSTEKDDVWIIEDSKDVVDNYVDTMQSSIKNAKEAKEILDKRWEDLTKNLDGVKSY